MRIGHLLAAFAALAVPISGALAKDAALEKAVAAEHRSPNFVARDQARHPQAVLEFVGLKPDMTVVEVSPGGGYWTEILAPYLHDKGTYYTASSARGLENWQKKLDGNKALYGNVKVTQFGGEIAPEGSADLVLTFRNVHNWMGQGAAEDAFKAFYAALKPGGVLGVEEHRARTDQPQDPKAANGYVREDYTIGLAEKAGFKLIGKSEVLANPKDTKDWARGVWTLPPTLALGEQDREKYLAIGEADNFLLKFQKPGR
ncbi:MAG: class I SAM-dependent methyltransferase [Steroidobacter sp.]